MCVRPGPGDASFPPQLRLGRGRIINITIINITATTARVAAPISASRAALAARSDAAHYIAGNARAFAVLRLLTGRLIDVVLPVDTWGCPLGTTAPAVDSDTVPT
jgi:hypothetical protein